MKVNFQAFRWVCRCSCLPLEDFLTASKKLNGHMKRNRILYFIEDNDAWKGLVLTIKDLKTFTKLVHSKKELRLDMHKLDDNEQVADFNFFVVDHQTGYGLYQHYHHSCSLNLFNVINKENYRDIKERLRTKEKKQLEKDGLSESKISSTLRKYDGDFDCSIVEKQGSFIQKIAALQDAQEAEIEFDQMNFSDGAFSAIALHLRRVKYQVFFQKNTSPTSKVRSLAGFLRAKNLKKAKVVGIDENGNDMTYKLFNDFDKFASYDYEDMVSELSLDQSKVKTSIKKNKIIAELVHVYDNFKNSLP